MGQHFFFTTFHVPLSTFRLMSPVDSLDFHLRFFKHLLGQRVGVTLFKNDLLNACINDHLRTDDAGMVCTIKGGSPDLNAMIGGLDDGILLCMEPAAELMSFSRGDAQFLAKATDFQAMFQSRRSSIVTGRQNLFVSDEHSPYLPSQTGRALCDEMGDVHEIFFPGRSMRMSLFFLFLFQRRAIKRNKLSNAKV